MEDQFITELNSGTATTTIKRADLIIVETDPSGTPLTKGMAALDLAKGWIEIPDSWTYNAANQIVVPTDATTLYQKGWGIRFKQGGAYKYYYMVTVAAALLTVTGGSDYTVANAAITDIAICPDPSSAFGFPEWFNIGTITWDLTTIDDAAGGQPTTNKARFKMDGLEVKGYVNASGTKVGTTAYVGFTIPAALPTPSANVAAGSALGSSTWSAGGDLIGITQYNTKIYMITNAAITDNTTITFVSGAFAYEV